VSEVQQIGPYKIIRLIGKGGMGRVYEAFNEQIERRVAIKVLHSQFAENQLVVQRFLNEAKAVNRVKHRCLVDVYEFGQLPDGSAYIVMEFLDGDTLHERLWREGGKLALDTAVRYARQIALALSAAHAKEIIHRDLKPANIMLVEDPETGGHDWIKVLDFGLARVREPSDEGRLTQTGVVMGTPAYMSPEQIRSARSVVDRSDVYTLGVILYEMLSGQKPFSSTSDAEMMFMHMSQEPKSLHELAPDVPAPLVELVHRMLKKNHAERPTAAQVASNLARIGGAGSSTQLPTLPSRPEPGPGMPLGFASTQETPAIQLPPVQSVPPKAALQPKVPDASSTAAGTGQKSPQPRRPMSKRLPLLVGAGLGGLLVVAGGVVYLRHNKPKEPERVSWTIRSMPPGADVLGEDGQLLGATPYAIKQPRQPGAQTLLLRKSGFNDARVTCERSADCERETMLVAQPPATPPQPPQPPENVGKDSPEKVEGKPNKSEGKKKDRKRNKKSKNKPEAESEAPEKPEPRTF
jgi:serine/threonine protein kinase